MSSRSTTCRTREMQEELDFKDGVIAEQVRTIGAARRSHRRYGIHTL